MDEKMDCFSFCSPRRKKFFSILAGLLVIVAIVVIVKKKILAGKEAFVEDMRDGDMEHDSTVDLLKKRYINGEISRKEFLQMKKDIGY